MATNLGHVAVNEAVFIIHNEVFEIVGGEHLPLPAVAQTRLLQQLPAALEGPLSCRQLRLRAGGRDGARGRTRGGRKGEEKAENVAVGDLCVFRAVLHSSQVCKYVSQSA